MTIPLHQRLQQASDDLTGERVRLAQLAEVDFTNQTNPRPAKAADYERLLKQAM